MRGCKHLRYTISTVRLSIFYCVFGFMLALISAGVSALAWPALPSSFIFYAPTDHQALFARNKRLLHERTFLIVVDQSRIDEVIDEVHVGPQPDWRFAQRHHAKPYVHNVEAVGFPWRSMRCSWVADTPAHEGVASNDDLVLHGGISLGNPTIGKAWWGAIPTTPIWPGLFGNMTIFASASAVGHVLYSNARRSRKTRRLRRGFCPRCKYSIVGIDGSICPECGTKLTESSNRADI